MGQGSSIRGEGEAEDSAPPPQQASAVAPPLKYEDVNREARSVLATDTFAGFRCELNKSLNNGELLMTHLLSITPPTVEQLAAPGEKRRPEGYLFAAQYTPSDKFSIMGRVDHMKRVFGTFTYSPVTWCKAMVQAMSYPPSPARQPTDASGELNFIARNSLSHVKVHNGGEILTVGHLHRVTPNLSIGGEGLYLRKNAVMALSCAARYVTSNSVASALWAVTHGGFDLSYVYKPSLNLGLATQFQITNNIDTGKSEASASTGWEYRVGESVVKARVNHDLSVNAVVEEPIAQFARLTLSSDLDFRRHVYQWGVGVQLST
eukprot:TRINITY_DN6216_c0_g1_i1.p1 TRINITY_DN6216_c0_g1~~TRINITY_DN6216_c0_g1_i1.p1  ORF type:complete len:328 (-),score=75.55 TRINITY_DN6216_c0_g1_i1:124-1080(-)